MSGRSGEGQRRAGGVERTYPSARRHGLEIDGDGTRATRPAPNVTNTSSSGWFPWTSTAFPAATSIFRATYPQRDHRHAGTIDRRYVHVAPGEGLLARANPGIEGLRFLLRPAPLFAHVVGRRFLDRPTEEHPSANHNGELRHIPEQRRVPKCRVLHCRSRCLHGDNGSTGERSGVDMMTEDPPSATASAGRGAGGAGTVPDPCGKMAVFPRRAEDL